MKADQLKRKLKITTDIESNHCIRLHRAISWLKAAEVSNDNPDAQFIFLWICFNSCYSMEKVGAISNSERKSLHEFLVKLISLDFEHQIFNLFWQKYSGPIRLLIQNKYLFKLFWDFHRGEVKDWEKEFEKSIILADTYLAKQDIVNLLEIVIDRLYVLRNQLIHGGATYKSKLNRKQLREANNILLFIVPTIIHLMLVNHQHNWGEIYYPIVD
jgi:hypothetical protein